MDGQEVKAVSKPMGRPTLYTKELANEICSLLSEGQSLVKVCKSDDMPCRATVFSWFDTHKDFLDKYEKAKEECADFLVEEMLEIADNEVAQPVLVEDVPLVVDGEMVKVATQTGVAHARLRVDTRKWAASKLKPKRYGDKLDLTSKDEQITTGVIVVKEGRTTEECLASYQQTPNDSNT
jgi:hypothetical protein